MSAEHSYRLMSMSKAELVRHCEQLEAAARMALSAALEIRNANREYTPPKTDEAIKQLREALGEKECQ